MANSSVPIFRSRVLQIGRLAVLPSRIKISHWRHRILYPPFENRLHMHQKGSFKDSTKRPSPLPIENSRSVDSGLKVCSRFSIGQKEILSDPELGRPERRVSYRRVNGIFWILLLNISIFAADHLFKIREIKYLYLYHMRPAWYQFITATFCHVNWNHLSSNLFFLYTFGKLVEEEEGNFALWLSYIMTGASANLVSWLVLPRNAVSVGASGAVFGLFTICVLIKMSWDWRKILEVLILGQFVIEKVMEAAQASIGMTSPLGTGYSMQNVNHIAHMAGALIGVTLILIISRITSQPSSQRNKVLNGNDDKAN